MSFQNIYVGKTPAVPYVCSRNAAGPIKGTLSTRERSKFYEKWLTRKGPEHDDMSRDGDFQCSTARSLIRSLLRVLQLLETTSAVSSVFFCNKHIEENCTHRKLQCWCRPPVLISKEILGFMFLLHLISYVADVWRMFLVPTKWIMLLHFLCIYAR